EGKQLARKLFCPFRCLLGVIELFEGLAVRVDKEFRKTDVAKDDSQKVVEIVSNTAGEGGYRLEFAEPQPLFLQLSLIGDVPKHKNSSKDATIRVTDGRGAVSDEALLPVPGKQHLVADGRR